MTTSPLANPTATRELLEEFGLATKHRLGQNFLIDNHVIERICERVGIIINGTMIECGTLAEICAGKSLEDRFFDLYQDHVGREETNISGKERA